ncbi:MAG: serine--tRNA ligase [Candidatus Moduliflexus flocculans]|nr:serine--tRNA ligase [Candidatus Moduliflexus flocculans]
MQNRLAARGPRISFDEFVRISREKKDLLKKAEDLRAVRNKASEEVSRLKKAGQDASAIIADMRKVGDEIGALEERLKVLDDEIRTTLLNIPNIPHESVPAGKSAEDNREVRRWGEPSRFRLQAPGPLGRGREARHPRLRAGCEDHRLPVHGLLRRRGARLERALISFMLDLHTRERGFTEVLPPFIANAESLTGTGNLPKFKEDLFKLEGFDWYLIPTAEVPLTNLYRSEILEGAALPTRFVAWTPCFRSEAGSYGKDVRGLIRQHQFNKVEMMIFSRPESSFDELEYMTASAEEVLKRLGLHHRVVLLCTGDMGFASAKTYDLEVWMPSRDGFMEISSCSNCVDFQARRLEHPLQARGQGQARVRPHAQRLGPGRRPDRQRHPGELPAGRRLGRRPRGPAALHGRPGADRPDLTAGLRPYQIPPALASRASGT